MSLVALTAMGQEEESSRFTYATYFHCDTSKEEAADAQMERDAPIIDGLVEDGTILAWGWLSHHTGGSWRRIRYHTADSAEGAFAALTAMNDAVTEVHGEDDAAGDAFAEACPRHDDYLWQAEAGSVGKERGKVGFSVYHLCDINREERADEIVNDHVAPILDKMVEDGKLTTWGWSSHSIGGKVRRLQTMTAGDIGALLNARREAIDTIYAEDNEAGEEFSDICGPHVDYVWNIDHEKS
jgi:hypothetical protein